MIKQILSSRNRLSLALLLATACAHDKPAAPPTASVSSASVTDPEGFTVLFDGADGTGWTQAGPGRMVLADGFARTEGGMGLWYYEGKSYGDFVLRLQFRMSSLNANAGVFVRFPRVDGDPWIPVKEGYEIQIHGDEVGDKNTGAVYSFKAPDRVPLRPEGEWNDYEIKAVGQRYEISLNGELINVYEGDRALRGMVGLQNHGEGDVVDFRNVRIKEL